MTAAFFDGEDFTVKVVFVDEVKGLEVGIEGMLGIEGIAGIEGVYGESVECRDEATSDTLSVTVLTAASMPRFDR